MRFRVLALLTNQPHFDREISVGKHMLQGGSGCLHARAWHRGMVPGTPRAGDKPSVSVSRALGREAEGCPSPCVTVCPQPSRSSAQCESGNGRVSGRQHVLGPGYSS